MESEKYLFHFVAVVLSLKDGDIPLRQALFSEGKNSVGKLIYDLSENNIGCCFAKVRCCSNNVGCCFMKI